MSSNPGHKYFSPRARAGLYQINLSSFGLPMKQPYLKQAKIRRVPLVFLQRQAESTAFGISGFRFALAFR